MAFRDLELVAGGIVQVAGRSGVPSSPGAQKLSAWADRAAGGADAVAREQQRRGAPRAATPPGIRDALPRAGRHQGPRQHYLTPALAPGNGYPSAVFPV